MKIRSDEIVGGRVMSKSQLSDNEHKALTRITSYLISKASSSETTLRQGIISLADQAVVSITNFVTGVIIARACSKDEFGLYVLGLTIILFITELQTSLLAVPYTVYSPRLKGDANALYTGSTVIHQLTFSLLAMLAVVFGVFVVSRGIGPQTLRPVLWALVVAIPLVTLREFARRLSFARLRPKDALLFDFCIGAAQISLQYSLVKLDLLSAHLAYLMMALACGIGLFAWIWGEPAFSFPTAKTVLADLGKNWECGKWIVASGIAWTLSANIYPWLLTFFHGTATVGVWAACMGVIALANPLLLGAQNFLGPKIAHVYADQGTAALNRIVLRASACIVAPMLLFCLSIMCWGKYLMTLIYGHRYGGNEIVMTLLAVNLTISGIAVPLSRALFAIERAKVDFFINFVAVFVMITCGVSLVRPFGVVGAASGVLTANVATSAVRYFLYRRIVCSLHIMRDVTECPIRIQTEKAR